MSKNLIEIKKINDYTKKMSNLKESLSFDDDIMETDDSLDFEPDSIDNDNKMNSSVHKDYDSLVNKIRKMALEGMSELAEDTNNENYQILKKIWQFCEKRNDNEKKPTNEPQLN